MIQCKLQSLKIHFPSVFGPLSNLFGPFLDRFRPFLDRFRTVLRRPSGCDDRAGKKITSKKFAGRRPANFLRVRLRRPSTNERTDEKDGRKTKKFDWIAINSDSYKYRYAVSVRHRLDCRRTPARRRFGSMIFGRFQEAIFRFQIQKI